MNTGMQVSVWVFQSQTYPGINPTWSPGTICVMCCWIQFVSIIYLHAPILHWLPQRALTLAQAEGHKDLEGQNRKVRMCSWGRNLHRVELSTRRAAETPVDQRARKQGTKMWHVQVYYWYVTCVYLCVYTKIFFSLRLHDAHSHFSLYISFSLKSCHSYMDNIENFLISKGH